MTLDLLSVSHSNNRLHSHSSLPLTDYSVCFVSVLSHRLKELNLLRSSRHSLRLCHSILLSLACDRLLALRYANGNSQYGNIPSLGLPISPKSSDRRLLHSCNASLQGSCQKRH